jgi:nucleoside-diphosphate-sugar epimerase
VAHPPEESRWFKLVRAVAHGEDVHVRRGGKEVHAADVARAAAILLTAENVAGQSYNCYDRYISEFDVATIAKELSGSRGAIIGAPAAPKHQIVTTKLQALGMKFGGRPLLEQTIRQLIDAAANA